MNYPTLDLANVEVCIPGKVLANRRVSVNHGAIKSCPSYTDHNSDQTKQKEKKTGVPTANIYTEKRTINGLVLHWYIQNIHNSLNAIFCFMFM